MCIKFEVTGFACSKNIYRVAMTLKSSFGNFFYVLWTSSCPGPSVYQIWSSRHRGCQIVEMSHGLELLQTYSMPSLGVKFCSKGNYIITFCTKLETAEITDLLGMESVSLVVKKCRLRHDMFEKSQNVTFDPFVQKSHVSWQSSSLVWVILRAYNQMWQTVSQSIQGSKSIQGFQFWRGKNSPPSHWLEEWQLAPYCWCSKEIPGQGTHMMFSHAGLRRMWQKSVERLDSGSW